jgi:delta8-fatty-acid desaturase
MQAYRIGKILHPWINLVPPLQGGVYRTYNEGDDESESKSDWDDESDWSAGAASWSSSGSTLATPTDLGVDSLKDMFEEAIIEKALVGTGRVENWHTEHLALPTLVHERPRSAPKKTGTSTARTKLSRAAYRATLEQQEIDSDIQAYPSLDFETQQAISHEYRDLHERIKSEGFYTCRYSEYGKDSIRWALLFAAFLFLLNAKWYLTSAAFLGMFWVGR